MVAPAEGAPAISGVSAEGGDVSITSDSTLTVSQTVSNSSGGAVNLGSTSSIKQNANIEGSGSVVLDSVGSIEMAENTSTSNTSGKIVLTSDSEIRLGKVSGSNGTALTLNSPKLTNPANASVNVGILDVHTKDDPTSFVESLNSATPDHPPRRAPLCRSERGERDIQCRRGHRPAGA